MMAATKRPSKVGTVVVSIASKPAGDFADWLIKHYVPSNPPPLPPPHWEDDQRNIAKECGAILRKASLRKRTEATFGLRIERRLAQWLAAFTRPEGSWTFGKNTLRAQPAPEQIEHIATMFLREVSGRRSTPRLKDIATRLNGSSDPGYRHRLRKAKKNLLSAREETKKVGRD